MLVGMQRRVLKKSDSPRTKRKSSFDRVRKLGRDLPGVTLGTSYGGPALKLDGRILACMATNRQAEPNTLVVRIDFFERDLRIANEPDLYYVKPHYVNYECVLARLDRIGDAALRDLLESGWRFVNTKSKRSAKAR